MSDTKPTPPAGDAPKKSKKTLFLVAGVVVLLAGGGGAYWMLVARAAEGKDAAKTEAAEEAEAEAEPEGHGGIVPLEPFVVNLADPNGSRFLRVSLSLVVASEEVAKEMEENQVAVARVRSAVLELLAQQTADLLVTPEGKAELKTSIAEAASHAVHELKVSDVLFSEFVVQF